MCHLELANSVKPMKKKGDARENVMRFSSSLVFKIPYTFLEQAD